MFRILKTILKKRKYFFIALYLSLIMAIASYYLTVYNVYQKSIVGYAQINGTFFTVVSLTFSLIISVLFGSYVALLIFRRDVVKSRAIANKITGITGSVTGIVVTGCPTCGVPLLGLVGLPFGLLSLPLKGLELKALSIGLLLLSIYLISRNIKKNLVCEPTKADEISK